MKVCKLSVRYRNVVKDRIEFETSALDSAAGHKTNLLMQHLPS